MDEEKAMMRLMKAIENPYTTILGHPTGRLLLSRKGYPINHKKIIDACAANQVVIEINANPHRLDMDWEWIDYAMNKNVMLSIDPDAHSIEGIDDIRFGVLASQKGGLTPEFNLSSFSLKEFETFLTQQKLRDDYKSIRGSVTLKVAPLSISVSNQIEPPFCSTIFLHMARPRPVPELLVVKFG